MVEVLKNISVDVKVSLKFVMNFGLIFYIRDMIFREKELLFDSFIRNGLKIYFCGLIGRIQNEKIIILKVVICDYMDIIYGFRMCFY